MPNLPNISFDSILVNILVLYERYYQHPYFRISLIVFSGFMLFLMVAYIKKHYFKISMRGARSGFIFGILFTLIIEAAIFAVVTYKITQRIAKDARFNQAIQATQTGLGQLQKVLGVYTIKKEK